MPVCPWSAGFSRRWKRNAWSCCCAALADTVLVPCAAPGSETGQLALALLAAGKQLFVLAHEDHQLLLEAGAITIDAESAMRMLEQARTHLPMR
jgi:hypothetical protein